MLGEDVCAKGPGMISVTKQLQKIVAKKVVDEKEYTVTFIDTPGFEPGQNFALIQNLIRTVLISMPIHQIWFLRLVNSQRMSEDEQLELLLYTKTFEIPCLLVLNQCSAKSQQKKVKEWIQNINDQGLSDSFQEISTIEEIDEEEGVFPDLASLCQKSAILLKKAPVNGDNENLQINKIKKQQRAKNAAKILSKIYWYVLPSFSIAAAGIGASPIPFSDVFLLVPLQIGLICTINLLFEQRSSRKVIASMVGALVASQLTGLLAKSFLKLIPGVNLAVMAANAAVASTFTLALGMGWTKLITHLYIKGIVFADLPV